MLTLATEINLSQFTSSIKLGKWKKFSFFWAMENDAYAGYGPAGGSCISLSAAPKFRNFTMSGFSESFHINSSSTTW